jgi:hypothetical protein
LGEKVSALKDTHLRAKETLPTATSINQNDKAWMVDELRGNPPVRYINHKK